MEDCRGGHVQKTVRHISQETVSAGTEAVGRGIVQGWLAACDSAQLVRAQVTSGKNVKVPPPAGTSSSSRQGN